VPSMGSVGDCYYDSMMEAFWSRMQVELLDRRRWRTRVELANAIFEYLEISTTGNDATAASAC
jgi:putative transposase